jgi:hypothetical protein
VATCSCKLSSDRSQVPRVILYTFSSKEDSRRATSSNHPLNLGFADSPLSPGGSIIPGTQGMSCGFVGDTTNRCWASPPKSEIKTRLVIDVYLGGFYLKSGQPR